MARSAGRPCGHVNLGSLSYVQWPNAVATPRVRVTFTRRGTRLANSRTIVWSANTCKHADTDVYLGLAPGLEDAALRRRLGPEKLRAYESKQVRLTSHNGNSDTIPLRLYALRDPQACRVLVDERAQPLIAGFQRVKLLFDPLAANAEAGRVEAGNGGADLHADDAVPVLAFLLTIGLARANEKHFFNGVISEFLDQSWARMPELLREVGCAHP